MQIVIKTEKDAIKSIVLRCSDPELIKLDKSVEPEQSEPISRSSESFFVKLGDIK